MIMVFIFIVEEHGHCFRRSSSFIQQARIYDRQNCKVAHRGWVWGDWVGWRDTPGRIVLYYHQVFKKKIS